MRARLLLTISALGACGFSVEAESQLDSDAGVDAANDPDAALTDGSTGCTSFSTQFDTCTLPPASPVTIASTKIYNTTTHVLSDVNGGNATSPAHVIVTTPTGQVDMLVATDFTLDSGSTLIVIGNLPFGIAATQTARISGTDRRDQPDRAARRRCAHANAV